MTSVSAPLTSMVTIFLNFLPNIIAAIIIIAFGAFLSKLVKQLVVKALRKTKLDTLQEKCGIEAKQGSGFSDVIGAIAYALVMIVFVVAATQVLNIPSISDPATSMVSQIFNVIPSVFVAIVLVAFGIFLANLVGNLLETVLSGTGLDQWSRGFMPHEEGSEEPSVSVSHVVNVIVKVVIDIIFVVAAIQILNIQVLTNVGTAIIGYMPAVLAAVLVLVVAWIGGNAAEKAILKSNPKASGVAFATKAAVIALAVFMALSQLGIAEKIINVLFLVMVASVGIAFAISFGIGGRDWAKSTLEGISKSTEDQLDDKGSH
ncbi:MAG: mechanosensitive ion channel [Atopobiaceae bacterium]|jgi:NADH:ubiquinone oxidoreductase subunit 3 (subunit A)|nr:mechanosensitive ion channel [Atopobiaceae bacterium]